MAKKIFEDELKVKKSFDYEQFSKKTVNSIELGNKSTFNFKNKNKISNTQTNNNYKKSNEVIVKITGDSKNIESISYNYITDSMEVNLFNAILYNKKNTKKIIVKTSYQYFIEFSAVYKIKNFIYGINLI